MPASNAGVIDEKKCGVKRSREKERSERKERLLQQKVQTVGDIGIGCAGIEVEEKQRQMRVEIFVTALYSFADDMVRYAAERLQRDHFVDAMIRQVAYLAGQEPALAEVRSRVDDTAALTPDIHDIRERSVERVVAAETVIDMRIMEQKAVDELCLPGA